MSTATWIFCDGDPWDLYSPADPLDEDEVTQTWEEFLIAMGGRRVEVGTYDLLENPVIHRSPGLSKYLADILDEGAKRTQKKNI